MNQSMEQPNRARSSRPAILRGLRRKCPACGHGSLFAGYLKQAESCSHCNEPIGDVRADDGPAWLTILIVGHLLAFPMVWALNPSNLSPLIAGPLLMTSMLIMTLSILPFAKGAFIGLVWKMEADASEQ